MFKLEVIIKKLLSSKKNESYNVFQYVLKLYRLYISLKQHEAGNLEID